MVYINNNYPKYYRGVEDERAFFLSPAICVVLIICGVATLLGVGFLALGYVADQATSDVDIILQLSGDDILVTLVDGGKARQIQVLTTHIEGHADARFSVQNPAVGEPVTFPNMGEGINGEEFVIVEATFIDGTEAVLDYVRLRFS